MTPITPIDPTKLVVPPFRPPTAGVWLKDTHRPPSPAAVPAVAAPQKWSDAEWDALRRLLDEIQTAGHPNKAVEASDMVTTCIQNGANTTGHIIAALCPYGYVQGHIISILTRGKRPWWRKNSDGRYALTEHHPLMAKAAEEDASRKNIKATGVGPDLSKQFGLDSTRSASATSAPRRAEWGKPNQSSSTTSSRLSNMNNDNGRRPTEFDWTAFHVELDKQQANDTADNDEQAMGLVEACIEKGINAPVVIIAALKRHGFDPNHLGKLLKDNTGSDPSRFRWKLDDEGRLHLLAKPKAF